MLAVVVAVLTKFRGRVVKGREVLQKEKLNKIDRVIAGPNALGSIGNLWATAVVIERRSTSARVIFHANVSYWIYVMPVSSIRCLGWDIQEQNELLCQ